MKNKITILLNLLMLLLSISMFSQKIFKGNHSTIKFEATSEATKLSPATNMLYINAKQNKENNLTQINLNSLARITLLLEDACTNFNSSNIFSDISKISDNISTAFIKLQDLPLLEKIQCIKYADIGEKLELEVNNARNTTNTNSVHMGTGISQSYTGTGVIVGVIDEGFDYTHPNFKDINGNLRISRVWERRNASGTPPSNLGFPYGSEYVGATAILNKQYDMINQSHGTHVAGTAAGTGTGNLSLLKGMAPNTEIVLVSDYNQVISTDNNYIDAINYIKNYANSVNKPVVINMSFGTGLGPHDGTTLEEEAINNLSNTPGIVLVAAAGNDGGKKKHAVMDFGLNDTNFIIIDDMQPVVNNQPTPDNFSEVDIWSQNLGINGTFDIEIAVYNLVSNTVVSSTTISGTVNGSAQFTDDLIDSNGDIFSINLVSSLNSLNNKLTLRIKAATNNTDQSDKLVVGFESNNNRLHAWCVNCNFDSNDGVGFTDGDDFFTVGSPASANGAIAVGSYNVTDENLGNPTGMVGGLSYFSSKGPRADSNLTIKPDITAPGNRIVSSLSSFDTNYQSGGARVIDVTNTFGTHSYGKQQGTSMASPVVSGIVALWLQAAPELTTNDVKILIANTSNPDNQVTSPFDFYGNTFSTPPNIKWGYGKIDALTGMQLIEQVLNVDTFDNSNSFVVHPNPTTSKIFITSKENVSSYEIYNTLGQKVLEGRFNKVLDQEEIDMTNLQIGLYFLNIKGDKTTKSIKIIKQ
jgi:minor extracellular serine protease Vpr